MYDFIVDIEDCSYDFEYNVTDADCIRIIDKYEIEDDKIIKWLWQIWAEEDDGILERLVVYSKLNFRLNSFLGFYDYIHDNQESVAMLYYTIKKCIVELDAITKYTFSFNDYNHSAYFFYPYVKDSRCLKVIVFAREEMRIRIEIVFCKTDFSEEVTSNPEFISTLNLFNNVIKMGNFLLNINSNVIYCYEYASDEKVDVLKLFKYISIGIRQCVELFKTINASDILRYKVR